jgi:signal transduction histidine kinase
LYSKNGIEISINLKSNKSIIRGNVGKFQQVVMNLLSNSKDALENVPNAKITIETQNQDNYFILNFSDNGKGIDENILDKIFVPFFTTKSLGKGTGLGLSYAYGIVTSAGGDITAESSKGTGTRFTITLPTN